MAIPMLNLLAISEVAAVYLALLEVVAPVLQRVDGRTAAAITPLPGDLCVSLCESALKGFTGVIHSG